MIDHLLTWGAERWEWLAGLTAGCSILLLVISALVLPWYLARLPHDYFVRELRGQSLNGINPKLRYPLLVAKNLLGGVLAIASLAMLVLPGQGLLTLVVALSLLDFPGKYRLERWVASKPSVRRVLNWLRERSGKRPFD